MNNKNGKPRPTLLSLVSERDINFTEIYPQPRKQQTISSSKNNKINAFDIMKSRSHSDSTTSTMKQ
ncbi:unnamed protein product [Leptidea sinapis]|uniref:Uncharacterized protein n=1 Tax=Leptidea sinapis TaxID=189913 RepID=A0A5E4PS89_9NEOP|nr:unnamed protein product [Leptidea sinapis]